MYVSPNGEKHVDMKLKRFKEIRESLLICDSLVEAKTLRIQALDSIINILQSQIKLRDEALSKKDSTIQKLDKNFKESTIECNQLLNQCAIQNKKERWKGRIEGGIVGSILGFLGKIFL